MRVTMIVEDNSMKVDDKPFRTVEMSELASDNVHAIQWYDNYGEIEYNGGFDHILKIPTRPPNEYLDSFADYEKYVTAYNIENAKQTLIEAAKKAEQEKMTADAAKAFEAAKVRTDAFARLPQIERDKIAAESSAKAIENEKAIEQAWYDLTSAEREQLIAAARG